MHNREMAETDANQTSKRRPSREGKKVVSAHVEPSLAMKINMLATLRDSTVQAQVEEALADLLDKHSQLLQEYSQLIVEGRSKG